jgi:hypothetical protein
MTIEDYKKLIKKPNNKYGAEVCEYLGRKYRSKGERDYAIKLDWLKKAGEIIDWFPQHKLQIIVNGVHICDYIIDFKVVNVNNSCEYHEYKGAETDLWKLKWKLVKALYPNLKFVLIKK